MWMKTVAVILLVMVRFCFPQQVSITEVIQKRYGINCLKLLRKLEKVDYKLKKIQLDIIFLQSCMTNGLIPKFLEFKLANRYLQNSATYKKCQFELLNLEIKNKTKSANRLERDWENWNKQLIELVSFI